MRRANVHAAIPAVACVFLLLFLVTTSGAPTYVVQPGDDVTKVAAAFGVSAESLRTANALPPSAALQAGQRLAVPPRPDAPSTYTVVAGDSVWRIAECMDVAPEELLATNRLRRTDTLRPGQVLNIPAPRHKRYQVEKGDTPASIAERFNVSLADLLKLNDLRSYSLLKPGEEIILPTSALEGMVYTVQRGDSLWEIADAYGVSMEALARNNGLSIGGPIYAGQRLAIPKGGAPDFGATLVETAMGYRGVPYRYGGTTSRGMDCSGLVYRVFQTHGVEVPHSSRDLATRGTKVTYAELRPGDLVFFRTRGRWVSHVGIFVGDNQFIHASSGRSGRRVMVSRLDEGYYKERLVCARRLTKP